ncbi:MAG: peptide-methionine (S)-S-oxide reductase MsrA [Bacteroidia bacterium]
MSGQEENPTELATLGAGCFWCIDALLRQLRGVKHVEAGYAGGKEENPTYEQVSSGATGHAEVARVAFDPSEITFEELLDIFWHTHDPTTLNRQGADAGPQYRSVIFYHNEQQKQQAEAKMQELTERIIFDKPIVTAIEPLTSYYRAENYHQNYYAQNSMQPYCHIVISPKLQKLKKNYSHNLKEQK